MKRLNRLFALLLALALVCGLVPAALAAAPAGPDAGGNVTINETNFPDANFRSLVSDKYDSDHNGVLSEVERNAVKEMACFAKQIANLKGVEFFTALTYLECGHNQLTSLDVSKNTELTELACYRNSLTSLDLSKNTALTALFCQSNRLTSLDVSKNTALTYLICHGNQLTGLYLRAVPALNWLVGYYRYHGMTAEHTAEYDLYTYEHEKHSYCMLCVDLQPTVTVYPFTDVKKGKYYYEPVYWAYYHDPQITSGASATLFGTSNNCTREQIVTFLWKAAGAPEPTTTNNPFTDVKSTKYYYKAVLWAVENGITSGVDATHFGVGQPCTREQAMVFLWKYAGSPNPGSSYNPFTDVKSGKWYEKAILWAVQNGITSGTSSTTFGVGQTCTRAQIVTFLYKLPKG